MARRARLGKVMGLAGWLPAQLTELSASRGCLKQARGIKLKPNGLGLLGYKRLRLVRGNWR